MTTGSKQSFAPLQPSPRGGSCWAISSDTCSITRDFGDPDPSSCANLRGPKFLPALVVERAEVRNAVDALRPSARPEAQMHELIFLQPASATMDRAGRRALLRNPLRSVRMSEARRLASEAKPIGGLRQVDGFVEGSRKSSSRRPSARRVSR